MTARADNRQGWLTFKRRPQDVVLIYVPGRERPIKVAVGDTEYRGRIPLSIQADKDIEIRRAEELDNNETSED